MVTLSYFVICWIVAMAATVLVRRAELQAKPPRPSTADLRDERADRYAQAMCDGLRRALAEEPSPQTLAEWRKRLHQELVDSLNKAVRENWPTN